MTQSTSSRWKLSSLRKFLPVLSGIGLGLLALQVAHSWMAAFGVGVGAQAAAVCSLGAGVWFFALWGKKLQQKIPVWGSWLFCIALTGVIPLIVGIANLGLRWMPISWLNTSIGQFLALLPGGLLMISLPTMLLLSGNTADKAGKLRGWGIAGGMGLGWVFFLPAWGPLVTLCIAAGVLCVCAGFEFRSDSITATSVPTELSTATTSRWAMLLWVVPIGLGFLWPPVTNMVTAWTLPSVWVFDARITAFAIGFLLATNWIRADRWLKGRSLEISLIALMLSVGSLTGGQDAWISFALNLHSNVKQPWLLELGRCLFIGLFPLTFGLTCGFWKKTSTSQNSLVTGTALLLSGWILSMFCLSRGMDPRWLICFGIGVVATSAMVFAFINSERVKITVRLRWPAVLSSIAVLVCLASLQPSWILPSRLIYSGYAMSQFQDGTDWDLLPYLDEGRPVSVTHTANGTWVGVDYRGLETFYHLNSVPVGYISHDSRIMPESAVDLMITTLPIVMHRAPQSVCFLGWGTGVPVATSLDFPLQQIDCFERDGALPRLTFSFDGTSPRYGLNPFQDDRVHISAIPPELAVHAISNRYDVIVSQPVRSEETLSVAEFTREYYKACADRLNAEGLFCQRFQHLDHGPDAAIDVIRTLKSVFPQVAMVDTSPGETLLFASRARDLDTTEFLVERLQRVHVRRILARCGWDWAHVLTLPAVGSKALDQLVTDSGGLPNSVLNHSVAVTHPPDAMRWSNKWEEKIERFSPFKRRFVDLAGEPGKQADVTRRMEEIISQRYVMTQVTDKPWAYRASIKELLQTKPRAKLIQTKGEKPHNEMHPVDQRRVDYLKALSKAYRDQTPAADKIHDLTAFIEPYDPLISYFLHFEAAQLYSRNPELDPQVEYLHLLNTIYFADSKDRSIHNVIRAIQLVHQHPAVVESDASRFDELHGLIQTLWNRWQLRQGDSPDSTDAGLTDVDESLEAAEAAIEDLRKLADASGYGSEAWAKRERILEQVLVRPLRGYRGQLLPFHEKSLHQKANTTQSKPAGNEFLVDPEKKPVE